MNFYKHVIVILVIFLVGGCATSGMMTVGNIANVMCGEEGAKNKNPLIEAEIDLTLLDELAAIVKLNQIILERMPISYEDKWPELLNDYYRTRLSEKEKKKKKEYEKCLNNKLKKDFAFYELYNPNVYAVSIISTGNLLYSAMGAFGTRMFIEGCKNLGLEFEHTKSVLSYVPFGCECRYFSEEFVDKSLSKSECNKIKNMWCYKKCDFFNRPVEDMLTQYIFKRGGIRNWADVPVDLICFRTVQGENLGTFKEVFYSLLPSDIMDEIKRIDSEIYIVEADYEEVKAKIKDTKYYSSLPAPEKKALKIKRDKLKKELDNKKILQKKLYQQAIKTLYVTEENIKKAKKLKEIVDFIDRSFAENMTVVLNLSVKIVNDVATMKNMNVARAFVTYPFLVKKGVFSKSDRRFYENRFKNIMGKLLTLPITSFEVLGYTIAQKNQVSQYKGYIEALIKMEEKLKK